MFRRLALASLGAALASGACTPRELEKHPPPGVLATPAPDAGAPAPLPLPPRDDLRVLVAGDLIPHRPRLLAPYRIAQALAPLTPLFQRAGGVVANLESATVEPERLDRELNMLAVEPAWLKEVGHAGISALTLANTHACDLGESGVDASIAAARGVNLTTLGADVEDPWAPRVVASRADFRVCAVAWTTVLNAHLPNCAKSGRLAVARAGVRGRERISSALARARDEGCGAVIAILHGGEEYMPMMKGLALREAYYAAEAGADAVVLHHPHVPSPVKLVRTTDARAVPIFSSVGNLVSNQGDAWHLPLLAAREDRRRSSLNAWTRLGVIADLRWNGHDRAPQWGYHLVWTDNDHALHREQPMPRIVARLLDPTSDRPIIDRLVLDEVGPRELLEDPCWIEAARAETCRGAPR